MRLEKLILPFLKIKIINFACLMPTFLQQKSPPYGLFFCKNEQIEKFGKLQEWSGENKELWLGRGSNNQNGNLRWFLPLGVGPPHPPPLMAQISRHFFTPLFFFCN